MGAICSCLCLEDLEEYSHSDASMRGNCSSLRCLAQQLLHVYSMFLQREEVHAGPLAEQGVDSSDSSASTIDDSISDTYHSPPRPLPYDDPRCSRMQHDGRHDKSSSHFHEESEPLRGMDISTTKCSGSNYELMSKLSCSKSSLKSTSAEVPNQETYAFPSYEDDDEDVCPTCLEDYTYENPRIVLKCSHDFHLGCIYEWKERSELCPVCGKVMVFDET